MTTMKNGDDTQRITNSLLFRFLGICAKWAKKLNDGKAYQERGCNLPKVMLWYARSVVWVVEHV